MLYRQVFSAFQKTPTTFGQKRRLRCLTQTFCLFRPNFIVFIDATQYLRLYNLNAREFAMKLVQEVLKATGITATAGIGTNLYLCKIAMDITAKHIPADKDGVRIAELDEQSFRRELWTHQPLTDFWRIGHGYANKLNALGLRTMGDVARMSLRNEDVLYRTFGINAELLIDHAWGWEPCTIAEIKAYKPESNSLSSGQVLKEPYDFDKARVVTMEMIDALVLDLSQFQKDWLFSVNNSFSHAPSPS